MADSSGGDAVRLLVLGDSVPAGERTDGAGWPARLAERDGVVSVGVHGSMGTAMPDLLSVDPAANAPGPADAPLVVLVQAGHNDAQVRDGTPRVPRERFREAAASIDERLADAVERHAFVGLVPMTPREGGVPLADDHPERVLSYDETLVDVGPYVPIADALGAHETVDGVHPTAEGHAAITDRVADWLAE